jgi:hypothetical protein
VRPVERRASAAARLTAVVVLPTPPFWLQTAMVRARAYAPTIVDWRLSTDDRSTPAKLSTIDTRRSYIV